jgi:DNA end-binding protein Ku
MVKLASRILDTKAGHFDPSEFKDEFEWELRKVVKRKAAGKTIEAPEREERPSNVVDLMEALRQCPRQACRRTQVIILGKKNETSIPENAVKGTRTQARRLTAPSLAPR